MVSNVSPAIQIRHRIKRSHIYQVCIIKKYILLFNFLNLVNHYLLVYILFSPLGARQQIHRQINFYIFTFFLILYIIYKVSFQFFFKHGQSFIVFQSNRKTVLIFKCIIKKVFLACFLWQSKVSITTNFSKKIKYFPKKEKNVLRNNKMVHLFLKYVLQIWRLAIYTICCPFFLITTPSLFPFGKRFIAYCVMDPNSDQIKFLNDFIQENINLYLGEHVFYQDSVLSLFYVFLYMQNMAYKTTKYVNIHTNRTQYSIR